MALASSSAKELYWAASSMVLTSTMSNFAPLACRPSSSVFRELGGRGIIADLDEQHRAVVVVRLGVGLGDQGLHGGFGIADFAVQEHDDQVLPLPSAILNMAFRAGARWVPPPGLGSSTGRRSCRPSRSRTSGTCCRRRSPGRCRRRRSCRPTCRSRAGFPGRRPSGWDPRVVAAYGLLHGAGDVAEHVHVVFAQLGFQTPDQGLSCVLQPGFGVSVDMKIPSMDLGVILNRSHPSGRVERPRDRAGPAKGYRQRHIIDLR